MNTNKIMNLKTRSTKDKETQTVHNYLQNNLSLIFRTSKRGYAKEHQESNFKK